jgi:transcriptional regulator with XRE-family HTH domain
MFALLNNIFFLKFNKMKTYQKIKDRAERCGLTIAEICKRTGIHKQTLDKWSRKEPKTLVYLQLIFDVLGTQEDANLQKYLDERGRRG